MLASVNPTMGLEIRGPVYQGDRALPGGDHLNKIARRLMLQILAEMEKFEAEPD